MSNAQMDRWAQALVGYSVEVQPGQTVYIGGGASAEPLFRAVYKEVINRGGLPVLVPSFTGVNAGLLTTGNDDQLTYLSPVELFARTEADVTVHILADSNTRALSGVDPARQQKMQGARKEIFTEFMKRETEGKVQWTLTLFPTNAYAQDAEMSLDDFADFVYEACKLNEEDTVAAWKAQGADQQRLVDWLTGKKEVHIVAPGTDLTLSVADRLWVNCDGKKNFPDGEVFTGPVENSANGHIKFSYPAIFGGREVDGVELTFENGKAVKAIASKGEDYLNSVLDTDEGARHLGEFAFGTNFGITRFIKEMLFDEKIGGTLHMALGGGYPETGSTNESAVHWDMLLDLRGGGTVTVDGELFLVDGKYVV